MKNVFKKKYVKHWWATQAEFDLSPTEALAVDLIGGLSRKKGWCFAAKSSIAQTLNISTQTLYNIIKTLKGKGLIEQHQSKFQPRGITLLRPTEKWKALVQQLEDPLSESLGIN